MTSKKLELLFLIKFCQNNRFYHTTTGVEDGTDDNKSILDKLKKLLDRIDKSIYEDDLLPLSKSINKLIEEADDLLPILVSINELIKETNDKKSFFEIIKETNDLLPILEKTINELIERTNDKKSFLESIKESLEEKLLINQ